MEFRCQLPTEILGVSKCTEELGIPAAASGKLQELQLLKECYIIGECRSFLGHLEAELQHLQVFLFEAFMLQLEKACMSCPWKHGGSFRLEGHCWQKEQIYKQKGWMNSQYPSKWGKALPEVFLCELTSFSSSTTAIRKILLLANRGWLTESCLLFLVTTLLSEWVLSRLNQACKSTWNSQHARW